GVDPIGQRFINTFAKPGANITGLTWSQSPEVAGKNLEFLRDVVPRLSRVGGLVDSTLPGIGAYTAAAMRAAQSLGLTLRPVEFRSAAEVENVFGKMMIDGD